MKLNPLTPTYTVVWCCMSKSLRVSMTDQGSPFTTRTIIRLSILDLPYAAVLDLPYAAVLDLPYAAVLVKTCIPLYLEELYASYC